MRTLMVVAALGIAVAPVLADWNEGDPYKMHFPQRPDPTGWDVDITTDTMYDDWQCSETGAVNDVHFWGSWKGGVPGTITSVIVDIWSDVPAGPSTPSHPGGQLWQHEFFAQEFTVRGPYIGDQGWYSPEEPSAIPHDHTTYWQINVENIDQIVMPWVQHQGTVYWLGLHTRVGTFDPAFGWKTSLDHWNDDGAFYYGGHWNELRDPLNPQTSLDLAFVITPEPAAALLLGLGLVLLRRR